MEIKTHDALSYKEVKGIFLNGCVDRGDGSSFRRKAHAHTSGQNQGWICVRGMKNLESKNLMLHEVAHILTLQGHTIKWMKKYVEIGGDINSDYFARYKAKYLLSV